MNPKAQIKNMLRKIPMAVKIRKYFQTHGNRKINLFGYKVKLDLSESIQYGIYMSIFEEEESAWVREILRPGMTFVDVGANIGYFSLLASSLVGTMGKVFSFEPSEYAYKKLKQTIKSNNIQNIHAMNSALGDVIETRTLLTQGDNTHSPSFVPSTGVFLNVAQVVTLDDFVTQNGIKVIDLIKIDVEGFEPNVIRGMNKIMSAGMVKRILIEIYDDWLVQNSSSAVMLDSLIRSFGFSLEKKQAHDKFSNCVYIYGNK
jgi:FkbM family methyltransferase